MFFFLSLDKKKIEQIFINHKHNKQTHKITFEENMEIALTPDIYCPIVDDKGNYSDSVPRIHYGISCPCNMNKDKVYDTRQSFMTHIKSKSHQKWLEDMNRNRQNHYEEVLKLRQTVQNQRLIIARLEREVSAKTVSVDQLMKQMSAIHSITKQIYPETNLLEL